MKTVHDFELPPELLEQVIANTVNGLTIADATQPDYPLIYVSPGFTQMTGYSPTEVIGQNCRFLQGDDRDQPALDELRAAIREGRTCTVTLRNYRQDGTLFWNELTLSPIHDAQGNLTHFVGIQQDVTSHKRLEQQTQQLFRLNQMGTALQTATTLDEIFQITSEQTLQIISGDRVSIALLAPGGDWFEVLALSGIKGAIPTGTRLPIEGTMVGKCLTENRLMTMYQDSLAWNDYLETRQLTTQGIQSTISAPLVAGGRLIGTLNIASKRPYAFSETEQSLMFQIVPILASAIDSQRLFEQLQTRAAELETVAEIGTAVTSILDPQHLLQEVVDLTKASFNLYHTHIYLLNEAGILVLTAGAGDVGHRMVAAGRTISLDQDQSLVVRAARTRQGVIVNDVQAEPGFLPDPLLPETRSEMAIPMIVGDRVLGVLDTQSDQINRFIEGDVQIKTSLASQVAVALHNAYQYEQAQSILAALQQSETRLSEALDIAHLSNWEFDFERAILTIDDKFHSILQARSEQEDGYDLPIELFIQKFVHPDDAEVILSEIQKALQVTDPNYEGQTEYRLLLPNDQQSYISVRYKLIRDEQGQIVKAYGTFQDITERRQAEEALRTSERQYQQILDAITDLILVKGERSKILWGNKAYRDYYDMTREELEQLIDAPFNEPDYTKQYVKDDVHVYNTGQILDIPEELITRHDGAVRLFSTVKSPIFDEDGNAIMTVGVSRDITERKQLQQQTERLYKASQRINEAHDLQEVIAAVAEALDVRAFNRMLLLIFEYDSTDELTGVNVAANWYSGEGRSPTSVGTRYSRQDLTSLVVFLSTEPLFFDDAQIDERFDEVTQKMLQALSIQSLAVLPLWMGGRQLGSFVIEAEERHHFTGREIQPYLSLASQAAAAVDNQRLLEETRAALVEVEATQRLYTIQAWETYRDRSLVRGYERNQSEIEPLGDNLPPEVSQAVADRQVVATSGLITQQQNGDQSLVDDDATANLIVPLTIRNEVIGVLGLQDLDQTRRWTPEEIALVQAIGDQFAQAAENLRLIDATQQRAAREKRVNEIGEKIQATQSLEEALQVAVKEVGLSLNAPQSKVQLAIKYTENDEDLSK